MGLRWWTLIAVSVAIFMLLLDSTAVNVALPSIRADLGASSFTDLRWAVMPDDRLAYLTGVWSLRCVWRGCVAAVVKCVAPVSNQGYLWGSGSSVCSVSEPLTAAPSRA